MRIGGHEFVRNDKDDITCNVCGMLYRDFLRAGGGCVVTNPPPRDATADTPAKESIALVIDGQEVGRIAVPDGVTVDAYSRYLQGVRYEIMDKLMPRAADTPTTLVPHAYNPDTGVCVRCDADRSKIMNPDDPCYISGTLKERRRAKLLERKPKPASLPPMKFGPLVPLEYKPWPPDPMECGCRTWAGDFSQMDEGHHISCPHRPKPMPAGELAKTMGKPGWYTPTPEAFGLPPAATSPERLKDIRMAEELAVTVVRRFAKIMGVTTFMTIAMVEILAREVAREFMAQYYKE